MKDISYLVRPGDQNVIVSKMKSDSVYDECSQNGDAYLFATVLGNVDHTVNEIKSVAVCSYLDEYDEELGKKIASIKADEKYHKKMTNAYWKMRNMLHDLDKYYEELELKHKIALSKVNTRKENIFKDIKAKN